VRVVIGSEHPLICEGLSAVIGTTRDVSIVGRASDWRSLLATAAETHPDLVLLDIERARFGWVRAAQQIRRFSPATVVACVSSRGDLSFLEEMSDAGAITKPLTNRACEEVLGFISPAIQAAQSYSSPVAKPNSLHSLTAREREILHRVARGSMSQEIAAEFGLSIRTVEFHRANILRKTGARSTADLIRLAIDRCAG
jgi:DNA-binding NarL/FixJ family response regulator